MGHPLALFPLAPHQRGHQGRPLGFKQSDELTDALAAEQGQIRVQHWVGGLGGGRVDGALPRARRGLRCLSLELPVDGAGQRRQAHRFADKVRKARLQTETDILGIHLGRDGDGRQGALVHLLADGGQILA